MRIYCADIQGLEKARARREGRSRAFGSGFAASLLEYAAADFWGLSPLPEIASVKFGKPHFPDAPERFFSLSHTRTHVLAVVADDPVGADIQTRLPRLPRVYKRLTSVSERRDFDFFDLWALRESVYKLTGRGSLRSMRFKRENGLIVPPEPGVFCRLFDSVPGCAVAVSSVRNEFPEDIVFVSNDEICS